MSSKIRNIAKRKANSITSKEEKLREEKWESPRL